MAQNRGGVHRRIRRRQTHLRARLSLLRPLPLVRRLIISNRSARRLEMRERYRKRTTGTLSNRHKFTESKRAGACATPTGLGPCRTGGGGERVGHMQFTECGSGATARPLTSPLARRWLERGKTWGVGEAAGWLGLTRAAERWLRYRTPGKACGAKAHRPFVPQGKRERLCYFSTAGSAVGRVCAGSVWVTCSSRSAVAEPPLGDSLRCWHAMARTGQNLGSWRGCWVVGVDACGGAVGRYGDRPHSGKGV